MDGSQPRLHVRLLPGLAADVYVSAYLFCSDLQVIPACSNKERTYDILPDSRGRKKYMSQ